LSAEAVICRGSELTYRSRITLRALFHKGLTVSQVARYFAINPVEVQMLNVRSPTDSTRRLSGGSAGGRVTHEGFKQAWFPQELIRKRPEDGFIPARPERTERAKSRGPASIPGIAHRRQSIAATR
jgi:hypothetical protein